MLSRGFDLDIMFSEAVIAFNVPKELRNPVELGGPNWALNDLKLVSNFSHHRFLPHHGFEAEMFPKLRKS